MQLFLCIFSLRLQQTTSGVQSASPAYKGIPNCITTTVMPAHSALKYQYSKSASLLEAHRCITELSLKVDEVKARDVTHDLHLCSVLVTPANNITCCQAVYYSALIKTSFRMQGSCKMNENSRPNSEIMYIRVIYTSIKQCNLHNKRLQ